jgi:type I restriction enzyme S subunit
MNSLFWDGGSVPFVTAADLTTLYVKDGRTFLTEDGLYSGKTIVCEKGDLLIGTRTRVGNCSIATQKMGASQDVTRARFNVRVVPEYFCWFFRNIAVVVAFYSQGTSIQGITRDVLNSIEIPVPPLDEQRRIVARIEALTGRAEEARELQMRAEEELKSFHPALLAKAFRGEL